MRTTIDLPDNLLRQAKATAALEGRTLKDLVVEAVELRLKDGISSVRRRVSLPLVPSRRPGSVKLTNDDVQRLMDVDDASVSP